MSPKIFIPLIILISFGVYSNTLLNGFVYDDTEQILMNPWIRDVRSIPEIFTSSAAGFVSKTTPSNYYRPMMHLIYMLNYYIFGLKPWGFHLTNILLHASVSVLVFIILKRLLARQFLNDFFAILSAFTASLLFATHPIHTEPVAWIAGVPELSYTLFFLLSFYFYTRSEEGGKGVYWLSVVSFIISLFCKEPAVMLPLALLAYDDILKKRTVGRSYFIRRYLPYFGGEAAYLLIRTYVLGGFSPQEPHVTLTAYGYVINIFPLFAGYLAKLFLPLNLNAFHVMHPIPSLLCVEGVVSLTASAAFIVLAITAFRRNNLIFLGLLIIALPLLPSLYIPALGENVFAERYLYLPSFGFVLLIAIVFIKVIGLKPGLKGAMIVCAAVIMAGYSYGTISRNSIWRDNLTLYTDMVSKSPDGAIPHNNLGNAYRRRGRLDEAILEHQAALKISPYFVKAHYGLGYAYQCKKRYDEAISEYKCALEFEPENAEVRNNLGLAYMDSGRFDAAIKEFRAVAALNPDNFMMSRLIEACYERMKETKE